jgi:hypothetical protein
MADHLSAKLQLRQHDRRGQTKPSAIPQQGSLNRALHQGRRYLELRQQRRRRGARLCHGPLRRHPDRGVFRCNRPLSLTLPRRENCFVNVVDLFKLISEKRA